MKEAQAKLLMASGVIDLAVIYRHGAGEGWEIHLYGEELPPSVGNAVELARGGRRTWSSLDTAHGWIVAAAGKPRITVEIDAAGAR